MTPEPDLVQQTRIFVRQLMKKGDKKKGKPVDKKFIDSLYERE